MSKRTKITDEMLETAVLNCFSFMEVLRYLGIKEAGGSHSHYKKRIEKLKLCTKHFSGRSSSRGKPSLTKKSSSEILIKRDSGIRQKGHRLTRALLEVGRAHCCSKCQQPPEWLGFPITLDVDHINEDWLGDREENLRFLCPNCHSQFSRGLIENYASVA